MILKIYGEIGWEVTAESFQEELDAASGDIEIHIASGGGSVFEGIAIYNAIKAYDRGKVKTVNISLAASMASYIALAGDEIVAYDNAVYMIHNASVIAWGDHRELRKKADILEGLSGITAKRYISKTGKTPKEIKHLMDAESFFYGEEMLVEGFVDAIIETDDDTTKEQAVALASETFAACIKSANARVTESDFEQAAAMLQAEQPKPNASKPSDKEGVTSEAEPSNAPRVNAMKARLSLKQKENHEKND